MKKRLTTDELGERLEHIENRMTTFEGYIRSDIRLLRNKVDELNKNMSTINNEIIKLNHDIQGNGSKGLKQQVDEHTQSIRWLRNKILLAIGGGSVLFFILSLAAQYLIRTL